MFVAGSTRGEPSKGLCDFGELLKRCNEEEAARHAELPPIRKNFYIESPNVAVLSPEDVDALRKQRKNISVEALGDPSRPVPKPIVGFEDAFAAWPEILTEIEKQGFKEPSPIQSQVWPIALSGQDVIGIAQTGTGKTLAYLLPAFVHIEAQPTPREKREGPTCLVLTPTRELALQIQTEVDKYHYRGIRSVCLYGGGKRREQMAAVENGVEIVIATPGRLNDLILAGCLRLSAVSFLVLDEADRMLDMGFEPQIKKVLCDVRPDRHSIMTSATWPPIVRELGEKYTKDPFLVVVGTLDLTACHNVSQEVICVDEVSKRQALLTFLRSLQGSDKALIFVGRKGTADDICSDLGRERIRCGSLHGDRCQEEREKALRQFRDGTSRLLIATDVASRGLDIQGITHVFNYDFPRDIEDYVHRVGRTGRAGRSGTSITLMTRSDYRNAGPLMEILEEAGQPVPNALQRMAEAWTRKCQRWGPGPNKSRYASSSSSAAPTPNQNQDFVNPSRSSQAKTTSSMGSFAQASPTSKSSSSARGGNVFVLNGGGAFAAEGKRGQGGEAPFYPCRPNRDFFVGRFPENPSGLSTGFGNFQPITSSEVPLHQNNHNKSHNHRHPSQTKPF